MNQNQTFISLCRYRRMKIKFLLNITTTKFQNNSQAFRNDPKVDTNYLKFFSYFPARRKNFNRNQTQETYVNIIK